MGTVRRVIQPVLLAAIHDELTKRGTSLELFGPAALTVLMAQILDSWHIVGDQANGNASTNGKVELLQETIGGHDNESWCMSTQQTITGLVEALAQKQSNLPASESCVGVWNSAKAAGVALLPPDSLGVQPGDVAVWQHLGSSMGHTGRVVAVRADGGFTSFEGNTSTNVPTVDRTGGHAVMKQRTRATMGTMFLLGFIREAFA